MVNLTSTIKAVTMEPIALPAFIAIAVIASLLLVASGVFYVITCKTALDA
jgi:hypothetical protein